MDAYMTDFDSGAFSDIIAYSLCPQPTKIPASILMDNLTSESATEQTSL